MAIKKIYFLFIIFILASGCLKRDPSEVQFSKTSDVIRSNEMLRGDAPLSYASLKKYVLKPKCMSCHSGPDAKPTNDPIDFSTYETAMVKRFVPLLIKGKPDTSRLFLTVESGEMPVEGVLHEKEVEFVKKWIEACAPKNEPEEIPTDCPTDDDDDDDDWDDDDDDDDWDDDENEDDHDSNGGHSGNDDQGDTTPSIGSERLLNVKDAISSSIKALSSSQELNEAGSFTSIEANIKDEGVKVTINIKNKKNSYSCHRHKNDDPYECHITED